MCTTFVNTQFSQCVFADTSRCSSIAVPINQSCALCVCYINKCDSFGFNVNTITHSPQPAPTHNCSSDGGGAFASNLLLKLWHDASARVCVWVPNVCGIDTRVRWGGGVERERASASLRLRLRNVCVYVWAPRFIDALGCTHAPGFVHLAFANERNALTCLYASR